MSRTIRNAPLAWFQRVLWLGIAANLALAVPTLLMPERMLAARRRCRRRRRCCGRGSPRCC